MSILTALILLPTRYRPDDKGICGPIEEEKFEKTCAEISEMFGGGTLFRFTESPPTGFWWSHGVVERDVLALIETDVPDTQESRDWLRTYLKEVLIARFRQKAMYLKLISPVENMLVESEEIDS